MRGFRHPPAYEVEFFKDQRMCDLGVMVAAEAWIPTLANHVPMVKYFQIHPDDVDKLPEHMPWVKGMLEASLRADVEAEWYQDG